MKIAEEKLRKILIICGQIIVGLAVAGGIFYYTIHNSEYSTRILEKDTIKLVDEILEENDYSAKCVKLSGLPDGIIDMKKEYHLEAGLSDGTTVPVKVRRLRENGRNMLQVEISRE